MTIKIHSVEEAHAWPRLPMVAPELSPFAAAPWLALDLSRGDSDDAALANWLRRAPVPVLGIGIPDAHSTVASACDVRVNDVADAKALISTIRHAPIAAAIFVRLLRVTETLDIESALLAESLAYSTLQSGPEYRTWLEANRAPAPAAHSDDGPAVIVTRDDDQLRLELNRPSNRNGMTVEMRDALLEALHLAASDDDIHRVQISGRGKCFSTGGDLTEFGTAPDPATAHIVRTLALPGRALASCKAGTTAKVHGACIGSGIEFPAFADRVVADSATWFQLPELKFGLIPGAGGCVSVPRRIGRSRTAWMVLSGERVDAETALDWGLVDAIEDAGTR